MTTKAIAQIEAAIGGLFPNGMASSWDVFVRREDAKDAFKAACNPSAMREVLAHIAAQDALIERLKIEAQAHAQEARTANVTIAEIYRLCNGATGEPGNWHGAEPVREKLAKQDAEIARLRKALTLVIERFGPGQQNYLFSKRDSLDQARAALTTKGTI